jgi:ElaB/YqjD/DUF883 family membrane-anchored ribosome-binding protein
MSESSQLKDQLVSDVKVVLKDTEELLRATASQAGDKAVELRNRLQNQLSSVKQNLLDAEAMRKTREIAKATAQASDHFVHEHPWKAVGIAAGVGLVIGLLIGRR